MEIIKDLIPSREKTSMALGYFDGVHSGHKAVISEAVAYAKTHGLIPAVFTMQQSPRLVLFGEAPGGIITLEEKLLIFERMGIERVYLIDFREIKNITAADFVKDILIGCFNASHAGCGFNYHFGSGAAGNGRILSELCRQNNISETTQPRLCYGGLPVSSTRIRQCISDGNIVSANAMLGRNYSFRLPVVHGRALGRTLGFPTMNQRFPEGLVKPHFGVYASEVTIGGKTYAGVTNIGIKPTVGSSEALIETWLPDYHGADLYDEVIEVFLLDFVRPEKKFDSVEELKAAVLRDAEEVISRRSNN